MFAPHENTHLAVQSGAMIPLPAGIAGLPDDDAAFQAAQGLARPLTRAAACQSSVSIRSSGGVVATDTDDFDLRTGAFFHSAKHGAWKSTGKKDLITTIIEFAYDASGNLAAVFRLEFDARFDDTTYAGGTGNVSFDAFLPGQDPLDADEPPVASGSGTPAFRRIAAH